MYLWALLNLGACYTGSLQVGMASTSSDLPGYSVVTLSSSYGVRSLKEERGEDGLWLVERINRRDRNHMKNGTRLLVPNDWEDELDYAPFPLQIAVLESVPKLIVVSLRVQAFAAYEAGQLVYWGAVNSGTQKQATPATLYHTNFRSRRKVSTINRSWIMRWYFNLHSSMGVAFHQYAMPGFPASYGCLRLLARDARWLYNWADEWVRSPDGGQPEVFGTPVVVFGDYDYDAPPPWEGMDQDPAVGRVGDGELLRSLEHYEWAIHTREEIRRERLSAR